MNRRARNRSTRLMAGFTLVEFVAVIVLTSIVFALGGLVLGRAFDSYALARDTAEVGWQGRVALERMVREMREIRTASSADIIAWTSSTIDFYDLGGNRVRFYQNGSQLARSTDGGITFQPLAGNLPANALNFYYYRSDGAAPASESEIYYLALTLTITDGGVTETYRAAVKPRAF
jgi:type II secretory pathway pseudopilin PulG